MRKLWVVLFVSLMSHSVQAARPTTWAERMGFQFRERSLKIARVRPISFAQVIAPEMQGLQSGDVITSVNGIQVKDAASFQKVCAWFADHRPQRWSFEVTRGSEHFIARASAKCNPLDLIGCGPLPRSLR